MGRLKTMGHAFRSRTAGIPHRYSYQKLHIHHRFSATGKVLDVGSGGDPFPYATVLADRYLGPTHHRSENIATQGKPLVLCDVQNLPFMDKAFAYVVCSHVLEHVDDPVQACAELQRVGEEGLIETPTFMKDALFAWASHMHKWHVVGIQKRLVFFEYAERQLEGIRSDEWRELVLGPVYHPLQGVFNSNQEIFNVLLEWRGCFEVMVMRLDGSIAESRIPMMPR